MLVTMKLNDRKTSRDNFNGNSHDFFFMNIPRLIVFFSPLLMTSNWIDSIRTGPTSGHRSQSAWTGGGNSPW